MSEQKSDSAVKLPGRHSVMQTYIAMLRGINVSGKKVIKMERLRATFAELGFSNVQTYVQSGNVVFEASNNSAAVLRGKIEQKILRDFSFSVPVFLKTSREMEEVIKCNPFLKDSAIDQTKLHVTFLSDAPPGSAPGLLQSLAAGLEQFHIVGREIFLYCPHGYGNTKLSNTAIERKLSIGATTRNWTTAKTLLAMMNQRKASRPGAQNSPPIASTN
jgi:uncharacterized protein (DUF1697 family)